MSRKRYSSGSQRWSPNQGKQKSTSTQLTSYDDSLTADCLIRTFMERGNMEYPILKMLFIGGSRPRENETERDLLFRRMKNCWMEKGKGYGMKAFLRAQMEVIGIETEIDGRWAKFQLMGAPLIINPKIWITKPGEEKRFLKDFQLDKFRDDRTLSESAARIQKYGFIKTLPELIGFQCLVHKWDQFPNRNPIILGERSKKIFHLILDDCDTLHHVILHGGQQGILDQFYQCKQQDCIQLIQQDWSQYISMVRGRQKIFQTKERKKQERENSIESQQLREIFQQLEKSYKQDPDKQTISQEVVSDQDSQRSRGQERKSKVNIDIQDQEWRWANEKALLEDISEIERAFTLAVTVSPNDKNLFPRDIFPNGLTKFVEQHGASNFLKFFLKLNYDYITSPTRKTEDQYEQDREEEFNAIRKGIINEFGFELDQGNTINNMTQGLIILVNAFYEKSNVVVYADLKNGSEYLLVELIMKTQGTRQRYFKSIQGEGKEGLKKIASRFNKILKYFGLAKLTIDHFMICPFCIRTYEKKEIFKHSCLMRVDLMQIKRGRRQ